MSRVVELLGPDGPLARALPGYEHRPGQLQMAEAVERALAEANTLICEAGTGTGKTLAYLVPAILSKRKVVISTATRALQDQIFQHDLPAIERYLDLHPEVALAKGLSNYLCRRRLEDFRASAEASRPKYATSLGMIERWVKETDTGDVAELVSLPEGDPVWHEVCSSTDTRLGQKCPKYADCFVTRMRRRCEQAKIVIANHHLVFADLALRRGSGDRGGALPNYEAIVFDEAHQIEDIASDFFGLQVSTTRVEALLRDAGRAFAKVELERETLTRADGLAIADTAHRASIKFFEELVARMDRGEPGRKPLDREVWAGTLLEAWHRLDTALEAIQRHAQVFEKDEASQVVMARALQIRSDLAAIADGEHKHAITWVESRARSAVLGSTPIEIASVLREQIFEMIPTVVLTSATLTSAGTFDFLRSRVGADSAQVRTEELMVPSPFDFESRALLYAPRDMPEPADPSFASQVARRAAELIEITGGGAFVLCTSTRAMGIVHAELSRILARKPMMQGDAPKQVLLSRFRADGHAVLVATMSFWEGVDVAGDALRLVVLDKIPFAVPTDPVVASRCAAIEQEGQNPFSRYHVPLAAITLKQGFGRLIRSQRDRGIVAVLDRRLVTKGYGRTLRGSLPPARRVESLQEVREFWRAVFG
ncbi:MAG: ATP-dependent DNA helicase [Deltaproteobacteria bacterium]|nr:ATP-dependent DNA helicase [Deltaproteobacteria bacterium]